MFRNSRLGPDVRTHRFFKMGLVRKWQLAKYRSVSVNHLTSPPSSRSLAPSCHLLDLAFSRVRLPRLHRCTRSRVQLTRLGLALPGLPSPCPSLLLSSAKREEPRSRDLDAVLRYPYCYRSR